MKKNSDSKYTIISEYLFIILPLVVYFLINIVANKEALISIFEWKEWSFCNIVLFGLCITKFIAGISKISIDFRWQLISSITATILVFGLIPSVIILVAIISKPNTLLYILQFSLTLISSFLFFFMGVSLQKHFDKK